MDGIEDNWNKESME